jgi:hypothetical protein
MANRLTHRIDTAERNRRLVAGSFAPDGVGAVTAVKGEGFTVARTGVGVFTVTLQDTYVDIECAEACMQLVAAGDTYAQVGAIDLAARTVVIRTVTGGVEADIAADADNRVHFQLMARN